MRGRRKDDAIADPGRSSAADGFCRYNGVIEDRLLLISGGVGFRLSPGRVFALEPDTATQESVGEHNGARRQPSPKTILDAWA